MAADREEQSITTAARLVTFKTSQGLQIEATLLRLTPQGVVFDLYTPTAILQLSEVLTEFKLLSKSGPAYQGEAVVSSILNTGTSTVCSATLRGQLQPDNLFQINGAPLHAAMGSFLSQWQAFYKVSPDYKLAVADLQNLLAELRLWLDELELGLRAGLPQRREQVESSILESSAATSLMGALFEKFESVASKVPEDLAPAHYAFCRRQLHPLLLCSPFMHRIVTKPLGYAGDYEMIDMIIRDRAEGESLFAKLLHRYILNEAPACSVRNRVDYFCRRFLEETLRISNLGRPARIYSLGCGPACEVQRFIADSPLAERVQFRLLDFNEETLERTGKRLENVKANTGRSTPVEMVKRSVHHLLDKNAGRPAAGEARYDLIYCSGLYDYLSDAICKLLNGYLYDRLVPGGVLIVTNFDPSNPIRRIQEHIFDWFLIYRNGRDFARLAPEQAPPENCFVWAEPTGCNIFLEVRKPLTKL